MSFTATIILIVFLIAAWILVRRTRNRDASSNRYRDYQTKRQARSKNTKVRPNRYSKPSRNEPELENVQEEKREVKPVVHEGEHDDPDVVLGLKEPPRPVRERPIPTEAQIMLKPPPPPPPLIIFHVMAEEGMPYNGYELLQTILSVSMRYGEHQIFHRHETKTGHGKILFSLSSAVKPGYFDLQKMGSFSTPGLSLFFKGDQVDDPIAVFELMLQVSGQFVEDLGGHVLDENRQLLTPSKVVELRQRLRHYIEGQQVPDLFEV